MQFFRRLFHRFRPRDDADGSADKSKLHLVVQYLDESEASFNLSKHVPGKELYDMVYNDLDFQYEHEYFGLQYTDFHNVRYWLDPTKPLKKQLKKSMAGPPYTFRFVVKFFSSEPDTYLKEELTRYLYVMQLKADLASGKLIVNDDERAAELAALVIQSEEGDFDPEKHDLAFVSQFRFLPEERQTEEFEAMVLEEYAKLVDRNLSPAMCERMYLSKVKYLENYGVDMHKVQGKDERTYQLGLTPAGILVYDGEEKIGFFFWQRILKIAFNRASLKIVVTEDDTQQDSQQDHTFVFKLVDARTCKHLWRCAVEHHAFFRLTQPKPPPGKAKQLLRLRSRFYHSFRTEAGLVQANQFGTSQRRSARFERKPSTRHSCRPSFARGDAERLRLHRSDRRPAAVAAAAAAAAAGNSESSKSGGEVLTVDVEQSDFAPKTVTADSKEATRVGPETIETKAIVVATNILEEKKEDAEEDEYNPSPVVSPTQIFPIAPGADSMATKPLASPTQYSSGGRSSQLPSPSCIPAPQKATPSSGSSSFNYSSSGQSDTSGSALSQRTVIEVAPPPTVALTAPMVAPPTATVALPAPTVAVPAPTVAPSTSTTALPAPTVAPQSASEAPTPPARQTPAQSSAPTQTTLERRPPPPQASGLRQPSAIPSLLPPPLKVGSAVPASSSNNGGAGGKSVSASALPAPRVLPPASAAAAAKPAAADTGTAGASVSASSLPRRISASDEAGGGSRIPGPSSTAGLLSRSRIPAPAQPQQKPTPSSPPPPSASVPPAMHTGGSGLPQPRAGMSGIPRLAPGGGAASAGAATGTSPPQFSLKL